MDWFSLLITALTDRGQCGCPITDWVWCGHPIKALMDWGQSGFPKKRFGPMWLPNNRLGLVWPPDNSTYRSGPLTFNPAGASLVLLLGVRPLTLNAGQPAALIEYISSIRIVDSCSCIAECSCSC